MNSHYPQFKNGYTLLETIIVITIASLVIGVTVSIFSSFIDSYRHVKALGRINSSAVVVLDRITRELKLASSIDYVNSEFNTHPGRLVLNSFYKGSSAVVDFYFDNGVLKMKRDGVEVGALTRDDVTVGNLIFYSSNNLKSSIVRTDIDLITNVSSIVKSATFYSSAVIRGGY